MSVDTHTVVGAIAGTLSTVGLVPQVVRTWRTRRTNDLSLGMVCLSGTGAVCWTAYGILMQDVVIISTNVVIASMFLYLVHMKLTESKRGYKE